MFSVNREVKVSDAGGLLFSPAFTRFPSPGLHAAAVYSLRADERRTHTASTGVVPLVGDWVAYLP